MRSDDRVLQKKSNDVGIFTWPSFARFTKVVQVTPIVEEVANALFGIPFTKHFSCRCLEILEHCTTSVP